MKTITWIGATGSKIELRAKCETIMVEEIVDLDGDKISKGEKPVMDATLELWVNGKKQDETILVSQWEVVDAGKGLKKIRGLKVGMKEEQAKLVDEFLKSVIADGKKEEAKEEETDKSTEIKKAESIVSTMATTIKNEDGTLMDDKQANTWAKDYNDLHNEGGEGYIPSITTQEQYDYAMSIIDGQ